MNKNTLQIGDLVYQKINSNRLALVLEVDEVLQMAKLEWSLPRDYNTWCSVKLLNKVE